MKRIRMKKSLRVFCSGGLLALAMVLPVLTLGARPKTALAASSCTVPAGYADNEAVVDACKRCAQNPDHRQMALWLSKNAKGKKAEAEYKRQEVTLKHLRQSNPEVTAYLNGMYNQCDHNGGTSVSAHQIWFAPKGMDGEGQKSNMASFINQNKYTFIEPLSQTMPVGAAVWTHYEWSKPVQSMKVKIKLGTLLKEMEEKGTPCKVKEETDSHDGNTKVTETTCNVKLSVNRCFSPTSAYVDPAYGVRVAGKNPQGYGCLGLNSKITIKIINKVEDPPEKKCTSETTYEEDPACFCSKHPDDKKCEKEKEVEGKLSVTSKVKVAEQGATYHDIHAQELESPENGTATIKMSTMEDEVEVEFEHKLNYDTIDEEIIKNAIIKDEKLAEDAKVKISGYGRVRDPKDKNPDPSTITQDVYDAREAADKLFYIPVKLCQIHKQTNVDAEDDSCTDVYNQFLYPRLGKISKSLTYTESKDDKNEIIKDSNGNPVMELVSDIKTEARTDAEKTEALNAAQEAAKQAAAASGDTTPIGSVSVGSKKFTGGIDFPSGSIMPPSEADPNKKITKVKVKTVPGAKVHICQKNIAQPRTYKVTYEKNELYKQNADGTWSPDTDDDGTNQKYEYVITGASAGSDGRQVFSKACVIIYRPKDTWDVPPTDADGDNPGPQSTATANSTLMYAGESSALAWDGKAKNINSLRVKAAQSVMVLVPVDKEFSGDIVKGDKYYKVKGDAGNQDVCTYYADKKKLEVPEKYTGEPAAGGCASIDLEEWNPGDDNDTTMEEYSHSQVTSVPDNVGYKVCNAMGWQYEHWVGLIKKKEDQKQLYENQLPKDQVTWTGYPEDNYWQIYDAKCRTIAKKPSVAFWNGSMSTQGGVQTALSYRLDNPQFGKAASGDTKTYGSWAEYLAVVGGDYYGLGTGASLWTSGHNGGSVQSKLCNKANILEGNTPLTISNSQAPITGTGISCFMLGHSGVTADQVFRGRLKTFMQENGVRMKIMPTNEISDDITSSGGKLNEITQNIIIANGDLVIHENVTQIDAWIFATGKIKTCSDSEWMDKKTEAAVRAKGYNTYPAANLHCDKQLVFNGPVIAEGGVELRRSFGSDALLTDEAIAKVGASGLNGRNRSAEIFNLRKDAYLWAFAQGQRYRSSFTDSYVRELAPRY